MVVSGRFFSLFWGKLLKIALVRFYGLPGALVWPASDRLT